MKIINDPFKASREGYNLEFNKYLKDAWKLFGSQAGTYIGIGLLMLLIQITISFIPIISVVGNFLSVILFSGFYIYSRALKDNQANTGLFFQGFNYAGNIFMSQLIILLLIVPLFLLAFGSIFPMGLMLDMLTGQIDALSFQDNFKEEMVRNIPIFLLSCFLVFCVTLYISLSFMFTTALIVDAKLGFWQALECSRKTVGKHFFSFLFMGIVYGILASILTLITCGVGLLLIIPFTYVLLFEMYDQIFISYDEAKSNILE